jgi:hypothetical protein
MTIGFTSLENIHFCWAKIFRCAVLIDMVYALRIESARTPYKAMDLGDAAIVASRTALAFCGLHGTASVY